MPDMEKFAEGFAKHCCSRGLDPEKILLKLAQWRDDNIALPVPKITTPAALANGPIAKVPDAELVPRATPAAPQVAWNTAPIPAGMTENIDSSQATPASIMSLPRGPERSAALQRFRDRASAQAQEMGHLSPISGVPQMAARVNRADGQGLGWLGRTAAGTRGFFEDIGDFGSGVYNDVAQGWTGKDPRLAERENMARATMRVNQTIADAQRVPPPIPEYSMRQRPGGFFPPPEPRDPRDRRGGQFNRTRPFSRGYFDEPDSLYNYNPAEPWLSGGGTLMNQYSNLG